MNRGRGKKYNFKVLNLLAFVSWRSAVIIGSALRKINSYFSNGKKKKKYIRVTAKKKELHT